MCVFMCVYVNDDVLSSVAWEDMTIECALIVYRDETASSAPIQHL